MVRSVRYFDTPDEIRAQVKAAIKALKSSQTINIQNVANRAAMRLHGSASVVKKYLEDLEQHQRIELGFPDPNERPAKSDVTLRPSRGIAMRSMTPGRRR